MENAFGRLKGRWRSILKRNYPSTELVKSIVLTCCVLHNLCELKGELYREEWAAPAHLAQPDAQYPHREGADGREEGPATRDALMST